jgi:antitoxin (DNA-binding transcriptional repressor) of toxin-antitoxin stability system
MRVSVHEAETQFSKLLDLVEQGEEVLIERRGHLVARLVRGMRRRNLCWAGCAGSFPG